MTASNKLNSSFLAAYGYDSNDIKRLYDSLKEGDNDDDSDSLSGVAPALMKVKTFSKKCLVDDRDEDNDVGDEGGKNDDNEYDFDFEKDDDDLENENDSNADKNNDNNKICNNENNVEYKEVKTNNGVYENEFFKQKNINKSDNSCFKNEKHKNFPINTNTFYNNDERKSKSQAKSHKNSFFQVETSYMGKYNVTLKEYRNVNETTEIPNGYRYYEDRYNSHRRINLNSRNKSNNINISNNKQAVLKDVFREYYKFYYKIDPEQHRQEPKNLRVNKQTEEKNAVISAPHEPLQKSPPFADQSEMKKIDIIEKDLETKEKSKEMVEEDQKKISDRVKLSESYLRRKLARRISTRTKGGERSQKISKVRLDSVEAKHEMVIKTSYFQDDLKNPYVSKHSIKSHKSQQKTHSDLTKSIKSEPKLIAPSKKSLPGVKSSQPQRDETLKKFYRDMMNKKFDKSKEEKVFYDLFVDLFTRLEASFMLHKSDVLNEFSKAKWEKLFKHCQIFLNRLDCMVNRHDECQPQNCFQMANKEKDSKVAERNVPENTSKTPDHIKPNPMKFKYLRLKHQAIKNFYRRKKSSKKIKLNLNAENSKGKLFDILYAKRLEELEINKGCRKRLPHETQSIRKQSKIKSLSYPQTSVKRNSVAVYKDNKLLEQLAVQTVNSLSRLLIKNAVYAMNDYFNEFTKEEPATYTKYKNEKYTNPHREPYNMFKHMKQMDLLQKGLSLKFGHLEEDLLELAYRPKSVLGLLVDTSDSILEAYPKKKNMLVRFSDSKSRTVARRKHKPLTNFSVTHHNLQIKNQLGSEFPMKLISNLINIKPRNMSIESTFKSSQFEHGHVNYEFKIFKSVHGFCSFLLTHAVRGNIDHLLLYIHDFANLVLNVSKLLYIFLALRNKSTIEALISKKRLKVYPRLACVLAIQIFCKTFADLVFCWKAAGLKNNERHFMLIMAEEFSTNLFVSEATNNQRTRESVLSLPSYKLRRRSSGRTNKFKLLKKNHNNNSQTRDANNNSRHGDNNNKNFANDGFEDKNENVRVFKKKIETINCQNPFIETISTTSDKTDKIEKNVDCRKNLQKTGRVSSSNKIRNNIRLADNRKTLNLKKSGQTNVNNINNARDEYLSNKNIEPVNIFSRSSQIYEKYFKETNTNRNNESWSNLTFSPNRKPSRADIQNEISKVIAHLRSTIASRMSVQSSTVKVSINKKVPTPTVMSTNVSVRQSFLRSSNMHRNKIDYMGWKGLEEKMLSFFEELLGPDFSKASNTTLEFVKNANDKIKLDLSKIGYHYLKKNKHQMLEELGIKCKQRHDSLTNTPDILDLQGEEADETRSVYILCDGSYRKVSKDEPATNSSEEKLSFNKKKNEREEEEIETVTKPEEIIQFSKPSEFFRSNLQPREKQGKSRIKSLKISKRSKQSKFAKSSRADTKSVSLKHKLKSERKSPAETKTHSKSSKRSKISKVSKTDSKVKKNEKANNEMSDQKLKQEPSGQQDLLHQQQQPPFQQAVYQPPSQQTLQVDPSTSQQHTSNSKILPSVSSSISLASHLEVYPIRRQRHHPSIVIFNAIEDVYKLYTEKSVEEISENELNEIKNILQQLNYNKIKLLFLSKGFEKNYVDEVLKEKMRNVRPYIDYSTFSNISVVSKAEVKEIVEEDNISSTYNRDYVNHLFETYWIPKLKEIAKKQNFIESILRTQLIMYKDKVNLLDLLTDLKKILKNYLYVDEMSKIYETDAITTSLQKITSFRNMPHIDRTRKVSEHREEEISKKNDDEKNVRISISVTEPEKKGELLPGMTDFGKLPERLSSSPDGTIIPSAVASSIRTPNQIMKFHKNIELTNKQLIPLSIRPFFEKIPLTIDPNLVALSLQTISLRDANELFLGRRISYRNLYRPDLSAVRKFTTVDTDAAKFLEQRRKTSLKLSLLSSHVDKQQIKAVFDKHYKKSGRKPDALLLKPSYSQKYMPTKSKQSSIQDYLTMGSSSSLATMTKFSEMDKSLNEVSDKKPWLSNLSKENELKSPAGSSNIANPSLLDKVESSEMILTLIDLHTPEKLDQLKILTKEMYPTESKLILLDEIEANAGVRFYADDYDTDETTLPNTPRQTISSKLFNNY
ncbi:hypothetical protein HELRODRAFT_183380 [Helobdella robusta]|uniref:Uncharacterized protein n=1 Tax=Helobdella robusta TaxID=6412 RepID=T1FJJ3_HELRO|nr:hypothetical protein HELRODRAFT_183380 [Helobdella robusta]ESO11277.1 hypothetical protein HELRODRAFT_183380 [Helobdella robusta]